MSLIGVVLAGAMAVLLLRRLVHRSLAPERMSEVNTPASVGPAYRLVRTPRSPASAPPRQVSVSA